MTKHEDADLQERGQWEDPDPQVHEPVRNPRAVVPVSFSREEFEEVARHAREHGLKISELIREALFDRVHNTRRQPDPITANRHS